MKTKQALRKIQEEYFVKAQKFFKNVDEESKMVQQTTICFIIE